MADDALVLLLGRLEEHPPVRPAFAAALREQLHRELGFATAPVTTGAALTTGEVLAEPGRPPTRSEGGPVPRLFGWARPVTPRMALLLAATLLLVACSVAAVYLAITTWVQTGQRGPQYASDYTFEERFREPNGLYGSLQATPDGRSIIARRGGNFAVPQATAIVRFDVDGSDPVTPEVILPMSELAEASLWDPGLQLAGAGTVIDIAVNAGFPDTLSVGPDGDLFVSAGAHEASGDTVRVVASSLIVVRPDGSAQKIVTYRELFEAGLLGHVARGSVAGTASASDRLWVRAEASSADSGSGGPAWWLFQVTDPNADGDWSDRVVRPLVLPDSVPVMDYDTYQWQYGGFVAEPSTPDRDRSRSILLPMTSRDGAFRIYRVADLDDDGDATGAGETELVFEGQSGPQGFATGAPHVTPRRVTSGPDAGLEELLVGGLTRQTRVSRITPGGVVDIARALPSSVDGVVALSDGSIYVASQEWGDETRPPVYVLYRMAPLPAGASPDPGAGAGAPTGTPTAAPTSSPQPTGSPLSGSPAATSGVARPAGTPRPLTPGMPSVVITLMADTTSQVMRFGADGSGPSQAIPDDHVQGFCQSADGGLVGFWSDTEAAGEPFLYVATADGSNVTKVSEAVGSFLCGFADDALPLLLGQGEAKTIIRHDLATGEETELVSGVVPFYVSPDGRLLAMASGSGRDTLEILELASGKRNVLANATGMAMQDARWSPDGARIAYVAGPPSGPDPMTIARHEVAVVSSEGGPSRSLASVQSRPPVISWSSDGSHLAHWAPTHDSDEAQPAGTLRIIDVVTGEGRDTGGEDVVFGAFSPVEPDTYAYATPEAIHLATLGGTDSEVVRVPSGLCLSCAPGAKPRWSSGDWMGWSPDGRFIGLGTFSAVLAVADVTSGEVRILATDDEAAGTYLSMDARWWREP